MVTGIAEHASKPVIPCREKKGFRAVALARVGRLLAGALMGAPDPRFPGHAHPGPPTGPAQHPAGLTRAQACGSSVRTGRPASRVRSRRR